MSLGLDVELSAGKIVMWVLRQSFASLCSFKSRLRATNFENETVTTSSSAASMAPVKTCESHLLNSRRAWAVFLSQRSNFSEEILRINFNCNVNMAEVDLLYGSSLHGKGLHRFWSRIEGYHGQTSQDSHFHTGDRGYYKLWDSRLFNYANWEVLRFLLSNLRWGLEEFRFEGFRFDGVASMPYHHHGINTTFTRAYNEYFSEATAVAAVVYLMMARSLIHNILCDATVIVENVSGTSGFCRSVSEGGIGFDYYLAMTAPTLWIACLKIDFPREVKALDLMVDGDVFDEGSYKAHWRQTWTRAWTMPNL
ncbi:hypothetical protein Nepgr_029060 [Nepenthes gracilis]|uniref:Uncharacterized protein n=1 Tax=Nepenthes gracilis TaxID=150966 RepID=A0AAD3TD90_NEPGR|nr:hypothetical protein Nepgr_029060 [Nepenthes gracilis]